MVQRGPQEEAASYIKRRKLIYTVTRKTNLQIFLRLDGPVWFLVNFRQSPISLHKYAFVFLASSIFLCNHTSLLFSIPLGSKQERNLQIIPCFLNTPWLARQIRQPGAVFACISPTERARLGSLAHVRQTLLERREQGLDGLGSQILVVLVVDLNHGRIDAGAEALDLDKCEEAVLGGLALLDAQVLLDRLDYGVTAAASELAGGLFRTRKKKKGKSAVF